MDIPVEGHNVVVDKVHQWHTQALDLYKDLLQQGVCPEQARFVLPQSMYTEFIETGSLYGYARLCGLRDSPDAQKEIRDYAQQVSVLLEKKFPVSWSALTQSQ
jgi:thymidylate synthase (FAD)